MGVEKIFVYGTLRRGGRYHRLICDRVVSAKEEVLEGYAMYDDGRGYPLMIKGGPSDFVIGEILWLSDDDGALFPMLDELEDAGEDLPEEERLYKRVKVKVGDELVWTYVYNQPVPRGARLIRDWLRERERR